MKVAEPPREIVFTLSEGTVLRISPLAVERLSSFIQTKLADREAGGVLLGRLLGDPGDIVIDDISAPLPKDKRSLFSFWRARDPHQKRVNEAWKASDGACNYLGEWHSHPEDDPTPSSHDISEWKRIVKEAKFEQDDLIFVIVGRKRMRAWSVNRSNQALNKLKAREGRMGKP